MTVIAWDGKTLAADKRCCHGMTIATVTKICRVYGELVGVSGSFSDGMELLDWFRAGADPKTYPSVSRSRDAGAALIVIDKNGKARKYELSPSPFFYDDVCVAAGCGDEAALVAMACGRDARGAVEMAIRFNSGCGNGIDTLELVP